MGSFTSEPLFCQKVKISFIFPSRGGQFPLELTHQRFLRELPDLAQESYSVPALNNFLLVLAVIVKIPSHFSYTQFLKHYTTYKKSVLLKSTVNHYWKQTGTFRS